MNLQHNALILVLVASCFSESTSGTTETEGSGTSTETETGGEGSSSSAAGEGTETGGGEGTETGGEGSSSSAAGEGTETETSSDEGSSSTSGAELCGDGVLQPEEQCEPGDILSGTEFVCSDSCVFDFSSVPQLYCYATCSYGGPPDCDQADADVYCRLLNGDPTSTATSYQISAVLDQPGFSCPGMGVDLGPMQLLGVPSDVWYQSTSLAVSHGGGYAVTGVVCSGFAQE